MRSTGHAARVTQHAACPKFLPPFWNACAPCWATNTLAFLASYEALPDIGLRVNTLKIAPDAFRQLSPFDLAPVPWCAAGFTVAGDDAEPGKHPYHAAGLYYLQDPSAMAVAELLDPQPGERVLDLAAAPGGKATHIAALMGGEGLLVANEIHPRRAWELAGNLERWGARNVAVTNETPERLAERFEGFFDRVLLDAPCSGEGMMRKSEAARVEWAPELVRGCALRQSAILEQAARLVRPEGRLAYATCTFNPEENEGTIARFLAAHPEFDLVEAPRRPAFRPAGRIGSVLGQVSGRRGRPCACPGRGAPARRCPYRFSIGPDPRRPPLAASGAGRRAFHRPAAQARWADVPCRPDPGRCRNCAGRPSRPTGTSALRTWPVFRRLSGWR